MYYFIIIVEQFDKQVKETEEISQYYYERILYEI
jgi:hypothetical protein